MTVQHSIFSALGSKIDIWEVGNEVNGNWTGNYSDVGAKIYDAWRQVHAARKRGALTLWYDAGCGNRPFELDPIAFTNQYVPADMRNGIDYVLVSYYETQCNNIRPSAATLTTFFNEVHTLYPNAKLGFLRSRSESRETRRRGNHKNSPRRNRPRRLPIRARLLEQVRDQDERRLSAILGHWSDRSVRSACRARAA